MTVSSDDVLQLLEVLATAGVQRAWVDGGWGVDALLGQQTRLHQDPDLVIEERDLPAVRAGLQAMSFVEVSAGPDWNVVMVDPQGRRVDLPADALTGCGSIGGRRVR